MKRETLRVLVEIAKEYTKKGWQKWVLVAIAAGAMGLIVTSCGTLSVKGKQEYEYYRKGKQGEELKKECSEQK